MSYRHWIAAVLATGLVLGACQPMPRPFQPDDKGITDRSRLPIDDKVGVFVAKVEGAPPAADWALTGALVERLHALDIPASRATANKASYVLRSNAIYHPTERDMGVVTLSWRLLDASGEIAGLFEQAEMTPLADWRAAGPGLVSAITADAAPRIASLILDPDQVAPVTLPDIMVRPVEGAPGDGPAALALAMTAALTRQDLRASRTDTAPARLTGALVVQGRMNSIIEGKDQRIELRWSVLDTNGREIGAVKQANTVPAGLLDQAWGDMAYVVATAAADSVVALLRAAGSGAGQ